MKKNMKKKMILFLSTSAFTTSLLFAQSAPPTPPTPAQMAQRRVDHLTQLLQLTTAQQATALGIFTTAITANEAAQVNLKSERQALQTAIETTPACAGTSCTPSTPSTSSIEAAVSAINAIEKTVTLNNASAEAQFYGTLTAAQQATYTASKNRGPGGFGSGGPGMGPGPQGFRRGPR